MKKNFILSAVFLVSLSIASVSLAHVAGAQESEVVSAGILPSNPFYFLKEWGRGIKLFFTFNQVKKAEYQLNVLDTKAEEIKQMKEADAQNLVALSGALEKYQKNVERLKARLDSLREKNNPNVEELSKKLDERLIKHTQLFTQLKEEAQERISVKEPTKVEIPNLRTPIKPVSTTPVMDKPTTSPINLDDWFKTVVYDGVSFNPSEIKIRKGVTVAWVNKSSGNFWPATNDHPIHQLYQGFDAKRSISSGENYSFRFDNLGTWKYHNHINAVQGGVVIVTE